ncbi:ankyrin repeat domain-containing protein 2 isoform X3 [Pimephales promelas]|uniref:ankyrin repeat domain-containing protein 2 isoform X3 n=1 Tax=Pimephales promelas TaxID=90988 RepID=UPI0019559078|nr:ankyrin repeat domain-containing protein 2 isoform X3 [Pimephales promelas]
MTSTNPTEAECCDLSTEDGGTHDSTQTTHERADTHPAGTDASSMDQQRPTFAVEEKESELSTHEFIPSSLGSEQHICELKHLTRDGLEPDLETSAPALAFTDESAASQSHSRRHDPTEQETEQILENEGFDQEELKQDHENRITQRRYDLEEETPAVVVTQPDEVSSSDQVEDIDFSVKHENMVHTDSSRNASPSDGTELSCDLLSLKSDTLSLISETAISCKRDEPDGPEEDTRSITSSSVMSLFHQVQMEPIEREWLRCAALGNTSTLFLLLQQDPTLLSKKDFVTTALHWAVKQGRVETVDMMLRSGADVNQRAHGGYTPLHLASLHGHGKIIQLLINNYNAKVNIRDYHGKMAAHYWNGSKDLFTEHRSHSAGSLSRGRRVQCYTQLSALLSRSHSNRNSNAEPSGRQLEPTPLNRSSSS